MLCVILELANSSVVLEGTSLSRCSVGAKYLLLIVVYMFLQFSCPWYLVILQFYYRTVLLSIVRELFEFYDLGLVAFGLECK
jgi:hypothetical protein